MKKKAMVMLLSFTLGCSLAACGAADKEMDTNQGQTAEMDKVDADMTDEPESNDQQKFPAFEGKDLDGNAVNSEELFAGNAVTVVNFWFTSCGPCVGELSELDALNKELADKDGALIGINSFTLNGDQMAISEAKEVLEKNGAAYQNVYADTDGELGTFMEGVFAYPTTYVVDRQSNIVGEPIVGAITSKAQADALNKLIDQAIAADMK